MRFASPTWRATLVRSACIVAVAVGMVACDSSTSTQVANQLAITGGDAQTVAVKTAASTPLTVVVTDLFNNPVANALVDWSVDTGDGTVKPVQTKTTLNGTGTVTFTGGATAGDNIVTASVGGLYVVHFTEHVQ